MEIINIYSPKTLTSTTNKITDVLIGNILTDLIHIQNSQQSNKEKEIFFIHIHNRSDVYENFILELYKKIYYDNRNENENNIQEIENNYVFIKRILNENKKNDCYLDLDRYFSFFYINYLIEIPYSSLLIEKYPVRLVVLKEFYFILTTDKCAGINNDKTNINNPLQTIQKIFSDHLNFRTEKDYNIFLQQIKELLEINNRIKININELTPPSSTSKSNAKSPNKKERTILSNFDCYEMQLSDSKKLNFFKRLETLTCLTCSTPNTTSDDSINKFKIEDFFYWIFLLSFDNLKFISDYLQEQTQILEEKYLQLQMLERRSFYFRMSNLEENILYTSHEIKIKLGLFSKILKKMKNTKYNLTFTHCEHFSGNKNIPELNKNIKLFLEQLVGDLNGTKLVLKNLEATLQMIKKTFRIILEDNQYLYEKKRNKILLYMTILITLLIPVQLVFCNFGMNLKLPIIKTESLLPFCLIALSAFMISIGQFLVVKCRKWI